MFNKRETAAFCSQLRSLLTAGLPLLAAMKIIEELQQSKKCRTELEIAGERLNLGWPLSQAASQLLPAPACGSLAAAERAGSLEENLGRLAGYYAGKAELDEKLAAALVYPVFVLGLSLVSVAVLVVFVLPGMKSLLADLEAELPPLTRYILALSDAVSIFWPALIVLPAVIMAAGFKLLKQNHPAVEKVLLRAPIISKLYRQEQSIQVFGTLGTLLQGGSPMIEALEIAQASTRSPAMKMVLNAAGQEVSGGEKLSASLAQYPHFPVSVIRMLKIGERTGQLDRMLGEIAAFQSREREALLKRSVALIEPCLTLAVGLVVGVVVLALFLPLVDLVSSLR